LKVKNQSWQYPGRFAVKGQAIYERF